MTERWTSPLQRAERLLAVRLVRLERAIDTDEGTPAQWDDYLRTLDSLIRVRQLLAPGVPARHPPAAIRQ